MRFPCLFAALLMMASWVVPVSAAQVLDLNGAQALAREATGQPSPSGLDLATFTVEAWIFPTASRTMEIASDSAYGLRLVVLSNLSGIELRLFKTDGTVVVVTASGAPGQPRSIRFNDWNHVAASFDSTTNTCVLSVNGITTTTTACLDGTLDLEFDQRFGVGTDNAGGASSPSPPAIANPFAGRVSGVRISNAVRYTANFTPLCEPDASGAVGLWLFREPTGSTTFTDSSGGGRTLAGVNGAATVDFATQPGSCIGGGPTTLVAAVLPSSRSVQVGTPATAFAAIINAGASQAVGVSISLASAIPATFAYQTTNCATNSLVGTINTPVNIPAGGTQCYLIAITPTAAFGPVDVTFRFAGLNTPAVGVLVGINTLLLSGNASPTPDPIAVAATLNNDGIVNIPSATGTGVFAVAVSNVGITGTVTVTADTGSTGLPVSIAICQTNAAGQCATPPGPSVSSAIPGVLSTGVPGTATYGIFVTGSGVVPFDPALNRIFVALRDAGGVVRGSTSVAVRTQ